jgi:hypothetical protein
MILSRKYLFIVVFIKTICKEYSIFIFNIHIQYSIYPFLLSYRNFIKFVLYIFTNRVLL